jgi:hypothetical protein
MAYGRIRTLKAEFFTSPTVMSLPSMRQIITLAGLICTQADDQGRLRDDAELIWSDIWVKRRLEVAVEDVVEDLTILNTHMSSNKNHPVIVRYEKKGLKCIWIPSFLEHQRISHPTKSKFPPPPRISRNLARTSELFRPDLEVDLRGRDLKGGGARGGGDPNSKGGVQAPEPENPNPNGEGPSADARALAERMESIGKGGRAST